MDKSILCYNSNHIFFNIGGSKNNLTICTYIRLNTETNETVVDNRVILNFNSNKHVELKVGTYKECYNFCVLKKEELENSYKSYK